MKRVLFKKDTRLVINENFLTFRAGTTRELTDNDAELALKSGNAVIVSMKNEKVAPENKAIEGAPKNKGK